MDISKLLLVLAAINGGMDFAVLVGKAPYRNYMNDKPSEEIIGYRYDIALQGNRLTTLSVKIEGADTSPHLTDEMIALATTEGRYIYCKFEDFAAKMYQIRQEPIRFTATAKKIILLDSKEAAK
ncbi:MAG: hypothetical protein KBI01_10030 [Oscillospiraceae bacterium]|nr:hypothetical protein [Oscillospiraceae bacterium]